MKQLKKPLLFALALLPVSVISVIFTCLYQFELYPAEVMAEMLAVFGSKAVVVAVSCIQNAGLIFVLSFFGYILAEKTGLLRPFAVKKHPLNVTVLLSLIGGILFALDPWIFGGAHPEIIDADLAGLTLTGVLASILYGGIIEEIMLRLFFMSLTAFLLWKIFCRNRDLLPEWVFVTANLISSLLFAAGHLPATVMTFGTLTPMILLRCFLFNGGFGLLFGWLYRTHGIQYSMLAHVLLHIVSKAIWALFL